VAGGENLAAKIDGFEFAIRNVQQAYPDFSVFATPLREVVHANQHRWGAVLAEGVRHPSISSDTLPATGGRSVGGRTSRFPLHGSFTGRLHRGAYVLAAVENT
jgi:hypothetical protein